ncbi:hypothetical protein [Candidatus Venteria ishoeyi]|uniref:DUF6884 domain-containing protein n=1 Tax=Candidatus Venteria ishoeyi TaxID=1899563 RepID=A0A1H6F8I7_9GAMM|nr:hypothetical protein [Candidatus Venteria ishoeyi]SEH06432.1 Uncharacterised protein [Candidatus Venteria ishoeyi]
MKMTAIIVTTCTSRKRQKAPQSLLASNLPSNTQAGLTAEWLERVMAEQKLQCMPAAALYCGRGFSEALKVRQLLSSELWIISAGLGLVRAEEMIPSYNLTLNSASPDSILKRCKDAHFSYTQWWEKITLMHNKSFSFSELITHKDKNIFCISVSKVYFDLIETDLLSLPDSALHRLRLFGLLKPGQMHERLSACLMPYDHRLDGPDTPIPGTCTDFPQRAMRHFIEEIYCNMPHASASQHAREITQRLTQWRLPVLIQRQRLPDEEIKRLIEQHWEEANSATQMLRLLRDKKNIACEQKRLSLLYKVIETQRATT